MMGLLECVDELYFCLCREEYFSDVFVTSFHADSALERDLRNVRYLMDELIRYLQSEEIEPSDVDELVGWLLREEGIT